MDQNNMVGVEDPDDAKGVRVPQPPNPSPSPSSLSTLRSVRKRSATAAKTWKKPMPMPPPPKVYRVDSINFRKVVQQLTGANGFRSRRLHSVAPPPLDLFTPPSHSDYTCKSRTQKESFITGEREGSFSTSLSSSTIPAPGNSYMSNGSFRPFGSPARPPSYVAWSPSLPVLSPGTLASFEQSSTILH
ncbi:uncharacterized protein LOC122090743 [Macadamia integrifolia]|uniref:uncharacterized protein LOC122090743 n=1 Tax=Macadamia integrifolia TaxID=60698 RepID=UPI001C4F8621|nr:uncharacterized protein LOC122090743 [Macadamia integrifolia]